MHCQVKLSVLRLLINLKICYLSISISVKLRLKLDTLKVTKGQNKSTFWSTFYQQTINEEF